MPGASRRGPCFWIICFPGPGPFPERWLLKFVLVSWWPPSQAQSKWNGLLSKESLLLRKPVKEHEVPDPEAETEAAPLVEPVTHWAPSIQLCRELLCRHDVASCLDLTAMDSQWALACLELGVPYTGIAQTRMHARLLDHRIKSKVLQTMLDPASPLFSSAFAAVDAAHSGAPLHDPEAEVVTPIKKKKGGTRAPGSRVSSTTKKTSRRAGPKS